MHAATALCAGLAALAIQCPAAAASRAPSECHLPGLPHSVLCGVVQRPLDPARPAGAHIDVHYVVVPALARRKLPDPLFLLAGGPGQSAIGIAPATLALFNRLNNRRDIVYIDQRGTGRSAPLACADTRHEPLAAQADPNRPFEQLMACQAALLKLPYIGVPADLGLFTTTIAMQDLDAVRRELGAARINLVGVSYGTRAALEYQRQFPAAVRRSVLDAVAPPDMALPASFSTDGQAAWDALLRDCEQAPTCQRRFPSLRADWSALLKGLPKPVAATPLSGGAAEPFQMTREMLLSAVRGALYSPAVAAALPAAVTQAAAGRYEGLIGLGALLTSGKAIPPAMGMHFSVVCAEDMAGLADTGRATANPPGADFGTDPAALYERVCARWPRGAVPAAFYRVLPSASPTLLFSGGLDPVTPPRHGERIAKALGASARHVVVANAGHGVMAIGCARDVVFRFIDAADDRGASAVDATCLSALPRPSAFRPPGLQNPPAKAAK